MSTSRMRRSCSSRSFSSSSARVVGPRRSPSWPWPACFGPEAWLLAGAYWLWLAPTLRGERAWIVNTALAGLAPFVWMGTDLITTGNPLFGFSHTTTATASAGLPTGASAVLELPKTTSFIVGRSICVAALVGFAAAMRLRRGGLLFVWLVGITAAWTVPVLAGTPLNARYFLATFMLVCVYAAYGAVGWWPAEPRTWRGVASGPHALSPRHCRWR